MVNHRTCETLFFAGTDTEVGKTYVASLVAAALRQRGHQVGVYKPVASGCRDQVGSRVADDAVSLWQAAGRPRQLDDVCPQKFIAPLAPPAAAQMEGVQVDASLLRRGADIWEQCSDVLVVEGAGGLFSPLAEGLLNIDLVRQFNAAKLVIVTADRLGVIHQTLAVCEAARHRGIEPHAIILSSLSETTELSSATNQQQISTYTSVPVLGRVAFGANQIANAIVQQLIQRPPAKSPPPNAACRC
ncbi:MAG: dethiobiotin synthase [Pirellulales bacterium]|nr:dethiobiotin synthase [Pirellulales bacterium]